MNVRNYSLIEGTAPVLVSAPHVFAHLRPSMRGVLKQGEPHTDELVKMVCSESGAYGIYLSDKETEYDPNYHQLENNLYKQEISTLVKNKKIKYLLDIHGLSDKHNYDVGITFCMRYRKSKELGDKILVELNKQKDLKDLSYYIGYSPKNFQETLTQYASEKLKIPSIQIEVARYIREDSKLLKEFSAAISSLILKL